MARDFGDVRLTFAEALAPKHGEPIRPKRPMILCHRNGVIVVRRFPSFAAARDAERRHYADGCGPGCSGTHTILGESGTGELRVAPGVHDGRRLPADLGEALTLLYPRPQPPKTRRSSWQRGAGGLLGGGALGAAAVRRKRRRNGAGSVYFRDDHGYQYWVAALQSIKGGRRTARYRYTKTEAEAHAELEAMRLELKELFNT